MNELTPISLAESGRLVELEKKIERGLETFLEVGEALAEIRDRKLYRIEHATFAEYCDVKWQMSDRRARQLIDSVAIAESIGKSGTIVPKSESQLRPLTKLEPDQQVAAWKLATANGENPTAKQVVQAVVEISKPESLTLHAQVSKPESTPVRIKFATLIVRRSDSQTFHIENPLPTWRVVDDANFENQQRIVCTQCWSYSDFGTHLFGGRGWFYQCRCKNSECIAEETKLAK
jgi:hypothetical protein